MLRLQSMRTANPVIVRSKRFAAHALWIDSPAGAKVEVFDFSMLSRCTTYSVVVLTNLSDMYLGLRQRQKECDSKKVGYGGYRA